MKSLIFFGLIFTCSFGYAQTQSDSIQIDTIQIDTIQTILLVKPQPQVNLFEQQLAKQLCYKAFFCRLEDDLSTKKFRVNVGVDVR